MLKLTKFQNFIFNYCRKKYTKKFVLGSTLKPRYHGISRIKFSINSKDAFDPCVLLQSAGTMPIAYIGCFLAEKDR